MLGKIQLGVEGDSEFKTILDSMDTSEEFAFARIYLLVKANTPEGTDVIVDPDYINNWLQNCNDVDLPINHPNLEVQHLIRFVPITGKSHAIQTEV